MKRTWVIVVAVAVVAVAGYLWLKQADDVGGIDLVEAFRAAEKRTPLDPGAAFSMDPQTIKGETKPAIYAHPPSRIIFHDIQVPANARLELFLAIKEEAWPKGTDGVYFRVGVSHGGDLQGSAQAQRRSVSRRGGQGLDPGVDRSRRVQPGRRST